MGITHDNVLAYSAYSDFCTKNNEFFQAPCSSDGFIIVQGSVVPRTEIEEIKQKFLKELETF